MLILISFSHYTLPEHRQREIMRKINFITFFITVHSILIFLQVHKHTLFIKNNYKQQEYEKQRAALTEKKEILTQELHALKDRETIKQFAYNTLKMRPYTLHNIIKLPSQQHDTHL